MDHGYYDLSATHTRRDQVVNFTDATDPQWSGVVELLAAQPLATPSGFRTDVFVLSGELIDRTGGTTKTGGFLSLYGEPSLTATDQGATLLVYRENAATGRPVIVPSTEHLWRKSAGMGVAQLVAARHHVALIRWAPQMYVPPHSNPGGEELFVLSGELRVNGTDLPAGSWLRLGAGERHDSGAALSTLILLRSGHLQCPHLLKTDSIAQPGLR